MQSVPSTLSAETLKEKSADYRFETYTYIVTITRADRAVFSILETEYEAGLRDSFTGEQEVSYHFRGSSFDMASGRELSLSELVPDEKALQERLPEALKVQYGTDGLAGTEPSDYSWTADALGIRFYFNSDAVSGEKRREIWGYDDDRVITVAFPYDTLLDGSMSQKLSEAPKAYIARIDRETVYDLPYGDFSIMLTKDESRTIIRVMPDHGSESSLEIEYADDQSDFYIIRSHGGFYLFREEVGDQDGFFYDFSSPDGGYGRFAYNPSQYFDSFMREIKLALPYDPYCAHMCEERRSFGYGSNDKSTFIPHGHYSFPDDADGGYKHFELIDDALQIDTLNTACRLLEDLSAVELDPQGRELDEITVKAGSAMVFESATGEATQYLPHPERLSPDIRYAYDCRLADGRRIRIYPRGAGNKIKVNGAYLCRFTEPVSLAEAQIDITPPEREAFTVRIGGRDYPLVPDYSKPDHYGEEIDFGGYIWWQVEGYVGRYKISAEDLLDMQDERVVGNRQFGENSVLLKIRKDGKIRFDYFGEVYEGVMPDRRYYGEEVTFSLESPSEQRDFRIIPRVGYSEDEYSETDGSPHDVPSKIELYSEGLPATNEPSAQPVLIVYLTRTDTDIPKP